MRRPEPTYPAVVPLGPEVVLVALDSARWGEDALPDGRPARGRPAQERPGALPRPPDGREGDRAGLPPPRPPAARPDPERRRGGPDAAGRRRPGHPAGGRAAGGRGAPRPPPLRLPGGRPRGGRPDADPLRRARRRGWPTSRCGAPAPTSTTWTPAACAASRRWSPAPPEARPVRRLRGLPRPSHRSAPAPTAPHSPAADSIARDVNRSRDRPRLPAALEAPEAPAPRDLPAGLAVIAAILL